MTEVRLLITVLALLASIAVAVTAMLWHSLSQPTHLHKQACYERSL
jgi:hypothetical protein